MSEGAFSRTDSVNVGKTLPMRSTAITELMTELVSIIL